MSQNKSLIALDVGEKRIGVAIASGDVRIAVPYQTLTVDGTELDRIAELVQSQHADTIIVGYPRNQSGEATAQTAYAEAFAERLSGLPVSVVFQDESLTSVLAEDQLKKRGEQYDKAAIDREAAAIILQDYLG